MKRAGPQATFALCLVISGASCSRPSGQGATKGVLEAGTNPGIAQAAVLAFETDVVALTVPFGEKRAQEVRIVGSLARDAQIAIEDCGDSGLDVVALPAPAGGLPSLRIEANGASVGVHVGNILVATGLERPSKLVLPYSFKVTGTLEVSPTNPYFNLRESGPKVRTIEVKSSQHDFTVRAARITEGPFAASIEEGAGNEVRVRVTVIEDRLDATQGAIGKLVIESNDRTEPRKEVPLVALGAVNRSNPEASQSLGLFGEVPQ